MENEERKDYKPLPKNAFDHEYMTERRREVQFLAEKGIIYSYTRETPDYKITQYKYKKTPALFAALLEFYTRLELEKQYRPRRPFKPDDTPRETEVLPDKEVSPDKVKEMQETLDKLSQKDDTE